MKFRTRRKPTRFRTMLVHEDEPRPVEVADVTEKGARIRLGPGELEPDAGVELHLRGRRFPARVVWIKEGEAGIAFERLLSIEDLTAINHGRQWTGPAKKRRFLMN